MARTARHRGRATGLPAGRRRARPRAHRPPRLDGYIDAYAFSYEIGAPKPDLAIFIAACRQLGVRAEDALMVGDDAVSDGGAGKAGLRVYILPPHAMPGSARGLDAVVDLVDRSRA